MDYTKNLNVLDKLPLSSLREVSDAEINAAASRIESETAAPPPPTQEPRQLSEEEGQRLEREQPQTQAADFQTFETPQSHYTPNGVNIGEIVNPAAILTLVDSVLPLILSIGLKTAFDIKVKKSDFKLSADERKTIEPHVSACMKTINIDMSNPWNALFLTLGAIYGSKAVEIGFDKFQEKKDDQGTPLVTPTKAGRGRPRKY